MTGSDYNFDPGWLWKALFALAIVGALTVAGAIIAGVIWFIDHVRFV